jgi:hypothetical protein
MSALSFLEGALLALPILLAVGLMGRRRPAAARAAAKATEGHPRS